MAKVIVTAGIQGSGSTWLYNAVRYALLNAGHTVYGVFHTAYKDDTEAEYHVVKAHDWDPALAEKAEHILMTVRNPLDCAASCVAKGLVTDHPVALCNFMRDRLEQERKWEPHAVTVAYGDFHLDPVKQIMEICKLLSLDTNIRTRVWQDLDNLKRTINNHVDHVTHFWPGHIKDGGIGTYAKRLSPASVEALKAMLEGELVGA